jgi:hypothetical protein
LTSKDVTRPFAKTLQTFSKRRFRPSEKTADLFGEAFLTFSKRLRAYSGSQIEPPFLPNDTRLRYTRSHVTPSEFLEKWSGSATAERSNAQSFVIDLCAVLNVDPPHAATSDADRDSYIFEKPVTVGKRPVFDLVPDGN